MTALVALLAAALATEPCGDADADLQFAAAERTLRGRDAEDGIAALIRCVSYDSECAPCRELLAATYAGREEWALALRHLDALERLGADVASARAEAESGLAARPHPADGGDVRVPIGTRSLPTDALQLEVTARLQAYDPRPADPADHYVGDVLSPKSVRFVHDGSKVYVNALEGLRTLALEPATLTRLATVHHSFGPHQAELFGGVSTVYDLPYRRQSPSGDPNAFSGKPVELALSHGARFLWVPYYRRDFDVGAGSPSAVAIVDTRTDAIVRVLPTGPIPKVIAISPDDGLAAIVHWGDNTVALVDTSSGDPATFAFRPERLVVDAILDQERVLGANRDAACGACLRGTVFSPSGAELLVGRMGGAGGIAVFDVASGRALGSLSGIPPNPRHLVLSPDGRWLYVTSTRSGVVSRLELAPALEAVRGAGSGRVDVAVRSVAVGPGPRTADLTADGSVLFVAVNGAAQLVAVDAERMAVIGRVRVDRYPVGLDIAPRGDRVWVTSQANRGIGGNSVTVVSVRGE